MDLFEIKKEIEGFTESINEIRGHLWSGKFKSKNKRTGRTDTYGEFLGWSAGKPEGHKRIEYTEKRQGRI